MKKTIAIALSLALAGTAASASNAGFGFQRSIEKADFITLDLVRADTAGTVEILDATANGIGPVIGTADVRSGANNDVRIHLKRQPVRFLTAVLRDVNGEIVATQRIDTN
ncbi:hypothetical protein [Limimaricola pyoseonensis]|uniref:Peptidase propeptide and YPEB domain-containing protein n=1 Tax=Limimaricola pyoseonensis TaxID=521013 RepID=A0A1G7ASQ4_9RHOB|nr:hypothetical protein [Limimaricola pyoseonensis]SDE17879.1 hypothetical protein SAMN04488567_1096 [Limimaricola pyoseonensis]